MTSRYPLKGVVVSLNTPFDSRGRIDFDSMARLIEMHLHAGCSGFLSPAQAGEVTALTVNERIEIIRFVHQYLNGRAAFMACATSPDEQESLTIAGAAVAAGCSVILTEVPPALRTDRVTTLSFCRSIAQIGMPVLAIQDLDWEGPGMDIAWIVQLLDSIETFRCLKIEVRPAGPKYTQVIEATQGRLTVAGGWAADQMIEALDRGVDIIMPTAMTSLYVRVVESYWAGDREAASAAFRAMLPVLAFTRQHLDISIQFYKRLMARRGIFSTTHTRKRCLPYDRYHENYGDELLRYLDEIDPVRA